MLNLQLRTKMLPQSDHERFRLEHRREERPVDDLPPVQRGALPRGLAVEAPVAVRAACLDEVHQLGVLFEDGAQALLVEALEVRVPDQAHDARRGAAEMLVVKEQDAVLLDVGLDAVDGKATAARHLDEQVRGACAVELDADAVLAAGRAQVDGGEDHADGAGLGDGLQDVGERGGVVQVVDEYGAVDGLRGSDGGGCFGRPINHSTECWFWLLIH